MQTLDGLEISAHNNDIRLRLPLTQDLLSDVLLDAFDCRGAYQRLQPKHQTTANAFNNGRGTALLPHLRGSFVELLFGSYKGDCASPRNCRYCILEQGTATHQHTWSARTSDELVRGDEDHIFVQSRVTRVSFVLGVDRYIRSSASIIPSTDAPVLVQKRGDLVRLRHDARHIRASGERADLQRAVFVYFQLRPEVFYVDVTVAIHFDHNDVGDRFTPAYFVGVVLVRTHKNHWALGRRRKDHLGTS
mmetsp:Transcript_7167/g.18563  ORF Transcript_7167/g.18563 Transcript_7167/m.18563 type:complete len:247 (+) Transcript_7167:1132-1872(+)